MDILVHKKDSPLVKLFAEIKENTKFTSSIAGVDVNLIRGNLNPVEKRFQSLHDFVGEEQKDSDESDSPLYNYLKSISENIIVNIDNIVRHSDPEIEAMTAAGKILKDGGFLGLTLESLALNTKKLDSYSRRKLLFLDVPILNIWPLILKEAEAGINIKWKNDVYNKFSEVGDLYPFDTKSDYPATLEEMQEFLDSFKKFCDEKLAPFIKIDARPARSVKEWQGRRIRFTQTFWNQWDKCESISKALFRPVTIELTLEDLPLPITYGLLNINDDMVRFIYDPSKLIAKFDWERKSSDVFSLSVFTDNGPYGKTYEELGNWAFLKLIDKAQQNSRNSGVFRWSFNGKSGDKVVVMRIKVRTIRANLLRKNFFSFYCPAKICQ